MVDFLMMFSLCICVLSGVTLLIVHIWSKKKQKKEEAEDKTGGTVFHSGTRNVPKPIKERAGDFTGACTGWRKYHAGILHDTG